MVLTPASFLALFRGRLNCAIFDGFPGVLNHDLLRRIKDIKSEMLKNKEKATHFKCSSLNVIRDSVIFKKYNIPSFDFLCFHFSECNPIPRPLSKHNF